MSIDREKYMSVEEVKTLRTVTWDGQGTSYPPLQDKMYDLGTVPEAQTTVEGGRG